MTKRMFSILGCCLLGLVLLLTVSAGGSTPDMVKADSVSLPDGDTIEYQSSVMDESSASKVPDDAELMDTMLAFVHTRDLGPEAVLAFAENLYGDARDLLQDEIDAAELAMWNQRPNAEPIPRPAITEASETLMNELAMQKAEASRQMALSQQDDPRELQQVELDVASPNAVASPSAPTANRFVGTGCPSPSYGTIAAALTAANPGDVLYLEGGITLAGGFTISKDITLNGGYAGCNSASTTDTTITGNYTARGMTIDAGLTVRLNDIDVINGVASGLSGGGIFFASGSTGGTLTLQNVTIQSCSAAHGGGIWAGPNSEIHGTSVILYNNVASVYGGGLRLMGASATFTTTNIYGNSAPKGAGVYGNASTYPSVSLDLAASSDVYSNNATSGAALGGGIYFEQGDINIEYASDVLNNNAGTGGGMYLITTTVTIAGGNVEIQGNTATLDGGGIWAVDSTIDVSNQAEIRSNTAASDGGGAYLDNSDLTVHQAGILYNTATADYGGGVYMNNGSDLVMDANNYSCTGSRCTQLSNNACGRNGGGVYASGSTVSLRELWIEDNEADYGGGVYVTNCTLEMNNALVARNDSTHSVAYADGLRLFGTSVMTGSHNTFAYNDTGGASTGTAIAINASSMTLSNSIIWGHSTSIDDVTQTVTCSDVQGGYTGSGNRNENPLFVSSGASDFHLQTSSPVIDRCASGEPLDFDQDSRPLTYVRASTPYDMGADEIGTGLVGVNNSGCVYASIQVAVNGASPGDTVKVSAGTFTESVDVNKNVTIHGGYSSTNCITAGAGTTTVDGGASGSVFDFDSAVVTLRDLSITNGSGSGGGVDALNNSHVTLQDIDIRLNTGVFGGGVYVSASSVVSTTGVSEITSNTASQLGGGVYVAGRFVSGNNNCVITYNEALHGGGISAYQGDVLLLSGRVYRNEATAAAGKGGGIYADYGSTISLENSTFIYFLNTAYEGGGLYADNSTITTDSSSAVFRDNQATKDGGAVYLANNSSFTGNVSIGQFTSGMENTAQRGAGIFAVDSTVDLQGRIINNDAVSNGAGMYADNSTVFLTDMEVGGLDPRQTNVLTGSDARGAGLYLTNGTQATLLRTDIISNTAPNSPITTIGIGILLDSSVLTMTDSSLQYHNADGISEGRGGGLYLVRSTASLTHCDILSNTASDTGGGIRVYDTSVLNLESSEVQYNFANEGGGLAIAAGSPDVNINNTDFRLNEATQVGGAILLSSGSLAYTGGWQLRQNDAGTNGGGIAIYGGSDVLIRADLYSIVYDNHAGGLGGFLYNASATMDVEIRADDDPSMYIYANFASNDGGAIAMEGGTLDLYGELHFDRNISTGGNGGAVYLDGADLHHHLVNSIGQTYWDSQAQSGGAIYAVSGALIECDGTVFGYQSDYNQATNGSGGAIYMDDATLNAENTIFKQGMATLHGGSIAAYNATVDIDADFSDCNPTVAVCSAFYYNRADSDGDHMGVGGAIFAQDSNVDVKHTRLYSNQAEIGGAYYQTGGSAVGTFANDLIYDNEVVSIIGAGIHSDGGTMTILNSTLARGINGAAYSQANTNSIIRRSIAWGNALGGFTSASGTMTSSCNIDQSGNAGSNVDPLFQDMGCSDYHLDNASPGVDACANGAADDFEGTSRPLGPKYDVGAYERSGIFTTFMPVSLRAH